MKNLGKTIRQAYTDYLMREPHQLVTGRDLRIGDRILWENATTEIVSLALGTEGEEDFETVDFVGHSYRLDFDGDYTLVTTTGSILIDSRLPYYLVCRFVR